MGKAAEKIDAGQALAVVTSNAVTPASMLNQALTNGAAVEVVNQLMALHERWEANQARKAFDVAIADAKAEIPPIIKNASVGYENKDGTFTGYKHETLDGIARIVDPILSSHGLSYRFRSKQENGQLAVTCIVAHRDGYFEETTLSGPPDQSGKKNAYQAVGSACTYLQRYTLKLAIGLSAGRDDDAQAATPDEADEPKKQPANNANVSKNTEARAVFMLHQASIRQTISRDALRDAWQAACADKHRIPADWQTALAKEKDNKLAEIIQAESAPKAEEPEYADFEDAPRNPDEFLQLMDHRMKEAQSEDDVIAVWHDLSPEDSLDFPPDIAAAQKIYEAHRNRFGNWR